jgi:hypothetical protein
MNCPQCDSCTDEGKRYCADCGAPLAPSKGRLHAYIEKEVNSQVQRRFKDKELIEIGASWAVASRIHGWAKTLAFFVGIPFAAFVLILGFLGFEKYSDLTKLIAAVEQQVKPRIEKAQADAFQAEQAANDAKEKSRAAQEITANVTSQINRQLGSATKVAANVQKLSTRVAELEGQTTAGIQASTVRIDARVSDLDHKIDGATKDISEQQAKLANTDELVKTLFSKGRTEYFLMSSPTATSLVVPVNNNAGAMVFVLLQSAPIYQTLELKWRVASQPRASYQIMNNLVVFHWGEPAENLKAFPLEVTYVP